jgi:murein DD-endopeptidase MepM/ murein hydrolase activator NlpD
MNLRKKDNISAPLTTLLTSRGRSGLTMAWEYLTQAGLAEKATRLGTHAALVVLILLFAWGLRAFYVGAQVIAAPGESPLSAASSARTPFAADINLPDFMALDPGASRGNQIVAQSLLPRSGQQAADTPSSAGTRDGVLRLAQLHTNAPSSGRKDVIIYVVKPGDTLFGIAGQFGLQPQTILWANQQTLGDNPHSLRPEQELNILPVDGAYHRWSAGDNIEAVARFFGVTPQAILTFPSNHIDPSGNGDAAGANSAALGGVNIEAGAWLVVPGGKREFVSWSAPVIPLDNPGVAKVLGPGACETVTTGVIGAGLFVWPAESHFISGFDYEPKANHPAIDIGGDKGAAVFAADSGVVVYAGWNNWGYGNVVVVNHGNGWQSLYAHLNAMYVTCGQSVFQGNTIAAIGATGNSTEPHLHFEMMYNGVKVNPHDYVK